MKHSSACNVFERCFGVLKLCWTILRSPSFYLVCTENCIIITCCLLHNLIRKEGDDPLEVEMDTITPKVNNDPIHGVETSDAWTFWRTYLANEMFNEWIA